MKFMVIFHIVMVKGLTEGTHSDGAAGRSLHSPLSRSCTCVELSLTLWELIGVVVAVAWSRKRLLSAKACKKASWATRTRLSLTNRSWDVQLSTERLDGPFGSIWNVCNPFVCARYLRLAMFREVHWGLGHIKGRKSPPLPMWIFHFLLVKQPKTSIGYPR